MNSLDAAAVLGDPLGETPFELKPDAHALAGLQGSRQA